MDASPALIAGANEQTLRGRRALLVDERLARQVRGPGRERAFAAIYERHHKHLYRYCRSILRRDADAEDALQSTFAKAYDALRDGRRSAPLRPWLFRIARNEAVSLLRTRSTARELAESDGLLVPSAEERARQNARLRSLLEDLRELPERQRSALLMRELNGVSHAEIGVALELSTGAAKQAILEARKGLQELSEGRAMDCDRVCRALSDADGRALRARRFRAHLRDCAECSAFAAAMPGRRDELRALVPAIAPAASAATLARILGAGASAGGSGAGLSTAVGAGKGMLSGLTVKALATGAVIGATVAGVGGVRLLVAHPPRSARASAAAVRRLSRPHPVGRVGHRSEPALLRPTNRRDSSYRSHPSSHAPESAAGRPLTPFTRAAASSALPGLPASAHGQLSAHGSPRPAKRGTPAPAAHPRPPARSHPPAPAHTVPVHEGQPSTAGVVRQSPRESESRSPAAASGEREARARSTSSEQSAPGATASSPPGASSE